jgi:hypothetical protein
MESLLRFVETKAIDPAHSANSIVPRHLLETFQGAIPNVKDRGEIGLDGSAPLPQGGINDVLQVLFYRRHRTQGKVYDQAEIDV